jgi:hypothetical protein
MIKPIVLSVVLYGSNKAITINATASCHPTWVFGGVYNKGSRVSQSKTTMLASGESTTTTQNYECISGDGVHSHTSHCPMYDPVGVSTSSAWSDEGVCNGTLPTTTTTSSTYAAWSGVGCPSEWAQGTNYASGAVAALDGIVYQCSKNQ